MASTSALARRAILLALGAWVVAVCGAAGGAGAAEYVWVGQSGNSWTAPANWSPPTSAPLAAGDVARFTSAAVADCSLSAAVSPSTVTLESGFARNLTVSATGLLSCADFILTSGTVSLSGLFASDRIRVSGQLRVEGGSIADVSCSGHAALAGGSITTLRMNGAAASVEGKAFSFDELAWIVAHPADFDPAFVLTLAVPSGHTTQTGVLSAGLFNVASGATYAVGPLSGFVAALHAIPGRVTLSPLSALVFTTGANVAGALDASSSGTVILCLGDWKMPGPFLCPSDAAASALIIQQTNGGVINHGGNPAAAVSISGADGKVSQWQSSNAIASLAVASSTTLRVTAGHTLTVVSAIGNQGLIQVDSGAVLAFQSTLRFVTPLGGDAELFAPGDDLRLRLRDDDANLNGRVKETVTSVTLVNTRSGDTVNVELIETARASGLFDSGAIPTENTSAAIADGILQCAPGDTIQATYHDPEDAADVSSDTIQAFGGEAAPSSAWQVY